MFLFITIVYVNVSDNFYIFIAKNGKYHFITTTTTEATKNNLYVLNMYLISNLALKINNSFSLISQRSLAIKQTKDLFRTKTDFVH